MYGYFIPPVNLMGQGALAQLGPQVKTLGGTKALIVTDRPLVAAGIVGKVEALLAPFEQRYRFRERLAGGTAAGGADSCAEDLFPFQSFVNDVQSYGYPLLFLSEDDGPNSKPQHWFGMGGFVYQYDKLTGAAYDVSRFYTRVVYCDRDEESNEYPWVTVKYRKYNFWANADAVQVFNVGDELSFWWDPEQSPIDPSFDDTGFEIDFKLVIDYGYEDDKFWIGATWSKPFDTLTWGY